MTGVKKNIFLLAILCISFFSTGCGQVVKQTGSAASGVVTTQSVNTSDLLYKYNIEETSSTNYAISFTIENPTLQTVSLMFPTGPVNYLVQIFDRDHVTVYTDQIGILCVISTITLAPGQSYSLYLCNFTKTGSGPYTVRNTINFLATSNKTIETTF